MKQKIISILLILILFSCESNNQKEKIQELQVALKKERKKQESLIEANKLLITNQNELRRQLTTIDTNLISKKDILFLTKEDSWVIKSIDNKKLLEFFFKKHDFKNFDAEYTINGSWMFHPGYGNKYSIIDEEFFANRMISKIDRSPESLEQKITPQVKEIIYSFFQRNNLYKKCGAYALVKSLLLAYDGFKDQKDPLASIYNIASKTHKYDDSIKTIISSMASEEILDTISDNNYTSYTDNNNNSTEESRLTTIYTFWARRHHENNLEFTHSLLKEIHQNITGEKLSTDSEIGYNY